LPFRDNSFDMVFHVGGINFFSDRRKALAEMFRVARAGSKLIVSDETEEVVTGVYQRVPFVKNFFQKRTAPVVSPTDLLPAAVASALDVAVLSRDPVRNLVAFLADQAWLMGDDDVAYRLHKFLEDRAVSATDAPPGPLLVKVWIGPEGRVTRLDFPSLGAPQADADLRQVLTTAPLSELPPPDMRQPLVLRLNLQIKS